MIRIFDLDSRQITTLPGSLGMTDPRWSPDGRFIAANSFDLHTLNIFDVGTQRWSALHLKIEMVFPEWSRDSQFIYFHRPWGDDRGIYRIRAKGGEVEKVVDLKNWQYGRWGVDDAGSHRRAAGAPRHWKHLYLRPHPGAEIEMSGGSTSPRGHLRV